MLQNKKFIVKSILTLIGVMLFSLVFAEDWRAIQDPKAK